MNEEEPQQNLVTESVRYKLHLKWPYSGGSQTLAVH